MAARCWRVWLLCVAATACSPVTPEPVPAREAAPTVAAVINQQRALRVGDLVFRRGRDVMSDLVLSRGQDSRFSHVGMVVDAGAKGARIIHAMPDEPGQAGGVRVESLDDFLALAVASDAAVYRLEALDAAGRQRLREYLLQQPGKPFDYDFALSTAGRLYCSELVLVALQQTGLSWQPATTGLPLMAEPVVLPDALRQLPGLILMAGG